MTGRVTAESLIRYGFSGSGGVYEKGLLTVFIDHRGCFLGHDFPFNVKVESMERLSALESAINGMHSESSELSMGRRSA